MLSKSAHSALQCITTIAILQFPSKCSSSRLIIVGRQYLCFDYRMNQEQLQPWESDLKIPAATSHFNPIRLNPGSKKWEGHGPVSTEKLLHTSSALTFELHVRPYEGLCDVCTWHLARTRVGGRSVMTMLICVQLTLIILPDACKISVTALLNPALMPGTAGILLISLTN